MVLSEPVTGPFYAQAVDGSTFRPESPRASAQDRRLGHTVVFPERRTPEVASVIFRVSLPVKVS